VIDASGWLIYLNMFLIFGASPSCHYNDHDNEVHQMPEQRRPEPRVPSMKCSTFTFSTLIRLRPVCMLNIKKVIQVVYLPMSLLVSSVSNSMLEVTSFPYE
jgi:hypothetical protein